MDEKQKISLKWINPGARLAIGDKLNSHDDDDFPSLPLPVRSSRNDLGFLSLLGSNLGSVWVTGPRKGVLNLVRGYNRVVPGGIKTRCICFFFVALPVSSSPKQDHTIEMKGSIGNGSRLILRRCGNWIKGDCFLSRF